MNKNKEIKRTAALVQETLNVPEDFEQRMAQVRERARQEYLARETRQAAAPRPERKKKGLGYRLVTAMAIALALMVLPVAVTLISPVPVSSAGDLSRSVVIWLNDTLHLQLRVPDTLEAPGGLSDMSAGEERAFHSLEEAAAFVGHDLIALGNEEVKCELQSIVVTSVADNYSKVTVHYIYENRELVVSLKSVLNDNMLAPKTDTTKVVTAIGDTLIWEANEKSRAFGIANEWNIQIAGECKLEEFTKVLMTLHSVR